VGVKAAAELAAGVFDGEAGVRESAPHASWYGFRLKEGKPRPPFKVQPTQVDVSTRAWKGRFMQDESGFVIPMRATDPLGPQEISTYVGAVLFSGTPEKAGKVRGLLALEAAAGEVTRLEALDFDGDGVLELVMEVETHAAGGYLLRDLVVASFLHRPAKILWSARTLDDGPGALVEEATFRQVTFREDPGTGKTDIHEEEGTRRYRIQKDLTRTRTEERIVNRRTHRLEGSRFRVAGSAEKVRR